MRAMLLSPPRAPRAVILEDAEPRIINDPGAARILVKDETSTRQPFEAASIQPRG